MILPRRLGSFYCFAARFLALIHPLPPILAYGPYRRTAECRLWVRVRFLFVVHLFNLRPLLSEWTAVSLFVRGYLHNLHRKRSKQDDTMWTLSSCAPISVALRRPARMEVPVCLGGRCPAKCVLSSFELRVPLSLLFLVETPTCQSHVLRSQIHPRLVRSH
ncbi:hypothetical protein BDQ17DRAFT_1360081 [Cyathus striatus]|nr:hypothetical protein BDQ17DRAFT_1360081 [Cyathus striatus]